MTNTGNRDNESAIGGQPQDSDEIPNAETGAGIGAGAASTFEPEEDATEDDAVEDSPASTDEELPAVEGEHDPTGEDRRDELSSGDA